MNGLGYSSDKSEKPQLQGVSKSVDADDESRHMNEAEVVSVILDLLSGLDYLHKKGICHR
jgi:serine/threonine protein kinase